MEYPDLKFFIATIIKLPIRSKSMRARCCPLFEFFSIKPQPSSCTFIVFSKLVMIFKTTGMSPCPMIRSWTASSGSIFFSAAILFAATLKSDSWVDVARMRQFAHCSRVVSEKILSQSINCERAVDPARQTKGSLQCADIAFKMATTPESCSNKAREDSSLDKHTL